MPLRLFVARRVAWRQRIVHGEHRQRILRIGGTRRDAADASKRLLKRQLPVRVDDIRSVEDPVSRAERHAIAGAPRESDPGREVFVIRDRPGCAGNHFVPGNTCWPVARSKLAIRSSRSTGRPKYSQRSPKFAVRLGGQLSSRPECNSPFAYTRGGAKTASSGLYNSRDIREAGRPAH